MIYCNDTDESFDIKILTRQMFRNGMNFMYTDPRRTEHSATFVHHSRDFQYVATVVSGTLKEIYSFNTSLQGCLVKVQDPFHS